MKEQEMPESMGHMLALEKLTAQERSSSTGSTLLKYSAYFKLLAVHVFTKGNSLEFRIQRVVLRVHWTFLMCLQYFNMTPSNIRYHSKVTLGIESSSANCSLTYP